MNAYNTLKIVGIEPAEFDNDFLIWMDKEVLPCYKDTDETFSEHIYNLSDIREQSCAFDSLPECYDDQMQSLETLLTGFKTNYFKIIN